MPRTAFAFVDNRPAGSEPVNEDSDSLDELLPERHAKHFEFQLHQAWHTTPGDTGAADVAFEEPSKSTRIGSNVVSIVPFMPPQSTPQPPFPETLHALQEWEGYVLESGEGEFTARLLDLTSASSGSPVGGSEVVEEAVFPLSEISDHDVTRLRPGSIFRWVIGYQRSASGTKRRVSQIVFRDLPVMTEPDRREGEEWAKKVSKLMAD